ncbi:hypothetical protein TRFO_36723 [Tritrichomonas foetus]|uniref:Uncharacterized protein n=1 Tax=Tritrichomonas foetus TaxID=1144522 RepID=A0A1J4JHQ1_9EUKA|nr:hypothetical protein TRFO_36723 [Tritrichomonas foetus]|eukprot:OHS97139.1 hypothetical protein TRFO_36723 [Tritrichomonas foetus]
MTVLEHPWRWIISEITKDNNVEKYTPKTKTPDDSPLTTLQAIYESIDTTKVSNLPFFAECKIERIDIDRDDKYQSTRISIVNFPAEMSTKLYVEMINAIFTNTMGFQDLNIEVDAISFLRRMQNFTIIVDVIGYDNSINPAIIQKVDEFLGKYRKSPEDTQYSIEIFPRPRKQYTDGLKKLSGKNTVDSVKNLLKKRQE